MPSRSIAIVQVLAVAVALPVPTSAPAQQAEGVPAVVEVLTTHPAFKAFPVPRISFLATTTISSGAGAGESRTQATMTLAVQDNGLQEAQGESEYSGTGGWSSTSTFRFLGLGEVAVASRSMGITIRPNAREESDSRYTVVAMRDVEGGLFPMREGMRLSFQRDFVSASRTWVAGGEARKPFEGRYPESVVMQVGRRVEAASILQGLPGAAWEVTTTVTPQPPRKPHARQSFYVEELAGFLPGNSEMSGTFTSRTVIDGIAWRDGSGAERKLGRTERLAVAAAASPPVAAAASPLDAQRLCAEVEELVSHARTNFEALRTPTQRGEMGVLARTLVAGAIECFVLDKPDGSLLNVQYLCTMNRARASPAEIDALFAPYVAALDACYPKAARNFSGPHGDRTSGEMTIVSWTTRTSGIGVQVARFVSGRQPNNVQIWVFRRGVR